jgi:hypothetical protein
MASMFGGGKSFTGGPTTADGRPAPDRFSFTLRLVVVDNDGRIAMDRRTDYLHDDPTLLPGFPKHYGASVDSDPTLAPIGPHYTNALLVATTDGVVHAYGANGKELPGWPVHTDAVPVHRGEPAYRSRAVTDIPHGSIVGAIAVGDLRDASGRHPDVAVSDFTGHVYAWNAKGRLLRGFPRSVHRAYGGPAARDQNNRLQRAFLGGPALAPLQGGKRLDVIAAAMDRHVYAWQPDGRLVPGWPRLLIDRSQISHVDPHTDKITFKASSHVDQGSPLVDTPAIGALSGNGRPDVVVGADEEYRGSPNVSVANPDVYALGAAPLLNAGNSRVYALDSTGRVLPGWPAPIEDLDEGLLPDVGDGTTGSPALADVAGNGTLEVGVSTSVGPPYVLKPDGTSALGTGPDGKAIVASATLAGAGNGTQLPTIAVEGMPIFAPLGPGAPGISLIDPAATLGKALDVAAADSQLLNNNDIGAWNATTGLMQPQFPQVTNDLEFIVSPIVADVAGASGGPYMVTGTASYDVRAVNGLGQEAPGFPKFDGGWMVNGPSFGPLGSLTRQVLAVGTREGDVYVWRSPTGSCASSGPWPREHHDLSNTSNLDAHAELPAARCRG